ncbi:hypothetical protein [Psychrobacter celer]|uniref:hypothetical protein n=1 Tax=Psychrobacter celer TaxID=306572 RepID=UPI003FCF949D
MSLLTPVSYAAKLYAYDDADAPQLADADGVIKTILKACLVTGYGTKESAGWTSLFEDANRIVLRMPPIGQSHGYPDLKIENGAGAYRVVSQRNPESIDDTAEIASYSLLSRDGSAGNRWYLVATDIGFIFWYQMAENNQGSTENKGVFISLTGLKPIGLNDSVFAYIYNSPVSSTTGRASPWMSDVSISNLSEGAFSSKLNYLKSTMEDPTVDVFNSVISGSWVVPSVLASVQDMTRTGEPKIEVDGLEYLRIRFQNGYKQRWRDYYIPITTWEL